MRRTDDWAPTELSVLSICKKGSNVIQVRAQARMRSLLLPIYSVVRIVPDLLQFRSAELLRDEHDNVHQHGEAGSQWLIAESCLDCR